MLLHLHTAMDLEEEKHKTCWFLLGQKKRGGGNRPKKGLQILLLMLDIINYFYKMFSAFLPF